MSGLLEPEKREHNLVQNSASYLLSKPPFGSDEVSFFKLYEIKTPSNENDIFNDF